MFKQTAEILIVDDHEVIRSGIRMLLSSRPNLHVCGEAIDGIDAVEKVRSLHPDIVLMDVAMPRMDGLTAMRLVQKESPDAGVIIVTQNDAISMRDESTNADGYVNKVHLHRDLIPTIERVLEHGHNGHGTQQKPVPEENRDRAPTNGAARDVTPGKHVEDTPVAGEPEEAVHARILELVHRNAEIIEQSEQLQELSSRLQRGQDEERRRIARELHDNAGQLLAVLRMNLDQLHHSAVDEPTAKAIESSGQLVEQLNAEIRNMSHLLHPPLLDESGLSGAVRWYVRGLSESGGFETRLDIPDDFDRLPADMELALFRIVQECLTNIHRHSGSKTAFIHLHRDDERVQLEVRDEGHGIPSGTLRGPGRQKAGVGIAGIRERVRHFGGVMHIDSSERGTTVHVSLPLPAREPSQTDS